MGETRVDLQHLLEDLQNAYTGPIEETILTEVIANALDASATIISFSVDRASSAFAIVDNGRAMHRREVAQYHDIAATTKTRGEGIGFAGVGIKLGLLVSREVITETRRGATHVATRWHLASKHRAPWKWIEPPGLVAERGTGVRLAVSNPLSPLLDETFLERTIRAHFAPLLDPAFADFLSRHYRGGVRFIVGNRLITAPRSSVADTVPIAIRLARKRTASAVGSLAHSPTALPEPVHGIAISTFGKVIKRGWDWLGLTPSHPDRITGVVEAPELAACLTLNKSDFIRSGSRGAMYLAYRTALQEIVSRQRAVWDDASGETGGKRRPSGSIAGNGTARRARYGLSLRFERRAGDPELARLLENTIWINEAHPAYTRAESSRALPYHIALSTALGLAPLAVAASDEHRFVTHFLAEWGAVHRDRGRERLGRRRPWT